jgi:phosphate transport system substrate-binding protein
MINGNLGRLTMAALAIMVIMAVMPATTARAQDASGNKVTIDGSTTVGPIAKAFAEYYMDKHPDVKITVAESGSGNGAKSLINGTCDIATMSRFMKPEEFKAAVDKGIMPVATVVAMDGIAVIANPANPIKGLTTAQITDIYTGKVTNWKDVGGPDTPIMVISRDTNSGTYEAFAELAISKQKMAANVEYVGSSGAMRQRVQSTQGAIGFVGLGFVDKTVKALDVNGIEASKETVVSGTYPISRPLFVFTNGYPKLGTHLQAFLTLYATKDGQEMIETLGFVALTNYEGN